MLKARFAAVAFVVAATVAPVPAASAAGTKCVALVVDATPAGGNVSTACVTVATSGSGSDVLVAGHHKVTFDPRYGNDFVCAIDGVPANGCHGVDSTHFWAYYHRAAGSTAWHISQEGAGTYQPANASTEGWVYDDGHTDAPAPPDVPYSSICTKTASASPSPSPTVRRTTVRRTTAAATRVTVSPTTRATEKARRTTTTGSATPEPTASTTPAPPVTATPAVATSAKSVDRKHGGSGIPVGLVIGVAAAVVVGTAAWLRSRRSRAS